jgi:catechol 2,3-dioxygenase-like lactoylglutathione lyase family enzyme
MFVKHKSIFLEFLVRRLAESARVRHARFRGGRGSVGSSFQLKRPSPLPSFVATTLSLVTFLSLAALESSAAVTEIGSIGLTVRELNKELFFYTNTLPFSIISTSELSGPDQDSLFGLQDTTLQVATLQLGDERITLTEHIGNAGKPIPPDSRSFDHWFQHIAIVVSDMDKAYSRLRELKVKHVSTAPETLPEWDKNAGGIKAFYFRDPEDHVLEIIWFPPGKGDPKWHSHNPSTINPHPSTLFLGIDHTAIVVSDTDKSLAFYRDSLGLRVAGESENYGVEQEHLNQVFGARLRITALRSPHGPGIELLEYITPPGGRPLAADASPRDLVFWNTHLVVDDLSRLREPLATAGGRLLTIAKSLNTQIVRDPDGHALQLEELTPQTAAAVRP